MLCEITIENVAVIEKATTSFADGFNVLTGETGAGKSIMIDSINAILGNRTSRDIVRSGAAKASIWATFRDIPVSVAQRLQDAGYPYEGELLLYREVTVDGKSNCRINAMPATAALLREVCGGLINIHGQHDNQSLLDAGRHLGMLDAFAQNEVLREEYALQYGNLTQVQKQMQALSMNEAEKERRLDLLRYEVDEIEKAELSEAEEETLNEQREIIRNSQDILDALNAAYQLLQGDDEAAGAATLLGEAASRMSAAARFAPELGTYTESLNEAYYSASEVATDIQRRLSSFDFDTHSLDEVEQRLDLIFRLKQKYGGSVAAVIAYGEKARAELETIEFASEKLEELQRQEQELLLVVADVANRLSETRRQAFETLNSQIAEALDFLNMPGIVMALRHETMRFGPTGQDDIEFLISTNPGENPKPLAKIASGGELARIMLAMKSALADKDAVPTVIYDEIDTGISGKAAGRIGQMLKNTAGHMQVICVTHTAQVAAYADRHLLIHKAVEEGRTYTHIYELDLPSRIHELARIISGDHVTDIALANAEEMLRMTGNSLLLPQ